ncbi:hypothetical protein ASPZODRAFT_77471 [Penicilliopsis zonata CBS 506.65]|uniref:Phytochrome chromophore attachment site domain-containing protein n=1 Tax=Penicilliopsis zonata CBS 506.65 TaxID=1073090 RepID=A0A1L9S4V0_9EURO|nr:hypothetical protein ASPZODRAFT_77471 [Penicilliopsis zonata CBS 506.65]OJJ42199.1 hypothetical protein ASPZODRAFT_77471 [Penicilliopsis zonata CBS 506.65]
MSTATPDSDPVKSDRTPSPQSRPQPPALHGPGFLTTRSTHVVTEGGHGVITGAGEASVQFQYCEDEPIHIPGAIQSFGAMLALREQSAGQLVVRVVSENCHRLMGHSPQQLFLLHSFCDILAHDQAETLLDHIRVAQDRTVDLRVDGPEVFALTIATAEGGEPRRFWCAVHLVPAHSDLLLCELELEDDEISPLCAQAMASPPVPVSTLGVFPTAEQIVASTTKTSQPLRILRTVRRSKGPAVMEVFTVLAQIQEQLGATLELDSLLNTTAGLVMELTGFPKVMIYRFDSRWNGQVVAELVDPQVTVDLYKGLRFPAADIPAQARHLYKLNRVRLLYDRDQITARLVCRSREDLETPLDMTHAYLRALSPVHLRYLAHMQVRSCMSISINAFGDLWGLISCHAYGTQGMRVSFPVRKMCRLLGETVARNIERLSHASSLQVRNLLSTLPSQANPAGHLLASCDDLMRLFDADYGALCIGDETRILGDGSDAHDVLALLGFLRMHGQRDSVLASHDIARDFPALRYPPGLQVISGLLYLPFSPHGGDFLVFFRKGQLAKIAWGGNPYTKHPPQGSIGLLEPRNSFAAWQETVLGQSHEWSPAHVEAAAALCFVCSRFLSIRRHKEAAMQNSQLTRILLDSSAHAFRTPLNAILQHLEMALDGALDDKTRDGLTGSYGSAASKSLIHVLSDLLDMANTKRGQQLLYLTMAGGRADVVDASSSAFGIGIRAWCITVIHEPSSRLRPDPEGYFFIEWQVFTLAGRPQ